MRPEDDQVRTPLLDLIHYIFDQASPEALEQYRVDRNAAMRLAVQLL